MFALLFSARVAVGVCSGFVRACKCVRACVRVWVSVCESRKPECVVAECTNRKSAGGRQRERERGGMAAMLWVEMFRQVLFRT